jgi:acetoacetyl-CoA synthetase
MPLHSKLWTPSREWVEAAPLTAFMGAASRAAGRSFASYGALHRWSIEDRAAFWSLVWDFCGIIGEKGERALIDDDTMPGASFFPDARLNFAENLLRKSGPSDAIVFKGEDKVDRRLSWDDLRALVSKLQQFFGELGVRQGDRVAAMLPNMPEAIAGMLATASLGAIWSSCSPDFGNEGVIDRFGQIEPVVFIACDGYWYNGKQNDVSAKVKAVAERLPTLKRTLLVDLRTARQAVTAIPGAVALDDALAPFTAREVTFERLPFSHPLYILFSSGTTGVPKCIVHSAGGVLLQHLKEHRLQGGIRDGDRLFYFTTCAWMMWNWLASGLASGATLLLYDGSPFHPNGNALFDFADGEKMTYFGTSAKFIDAARKAGLEPIRTHELSTVRTISSTGSSLSPEGFSYIYDSVKKDVHLASISGSTDITSCFVLGVPTEPVHVGEIQGPGLGMAVDVWDDDGRPVVGVKASWFARRPSRRCRSASGTIPMARSTTAPISSVSTMFGAMAISPSGPSMAA